MFKIKLKKKLPDLAKQIDIGIVNSEIKGNSSCASVKPDIINQKL